MRCLCCNKEISPNQANENGWHKSCIKKFFGTETIPTLDLTEDFLEELANNSVNKGLTVPGVQKKLSLHLSGAKKDSRFTLVDYPTGFILKPQSSDYKLLPEAEFLSMTMAKSVGIQTVPFGLLRLNDKFAYITKRVDRIDNQKFAMEDFCQLDGRMTANKYSGSYEVCGKIITKYSTRPGLDLTELFLRLVFCYITGNSDMHLKNFSLIEQTAGGRDFALSPAYDLLPVNVILPADKEFTALTLNGKKRNQRRKDFLELSNNYNLNKNVAERIIGNVLRRQNELMDMVSESYLDEEYKVVMLELMRERIEMIG